MSEDWQADVQAFHKKFGVLVNHWPVVPKDMARTSAGMMGTGELRKNLIYEEAVELGEAIEREDLVKIADGICDLIYVALGTATSYGIRIQPIWNIVHRANMAKEGGQIREDGKILKPPNWRPPEDDISTELYRQEDEGVHG